ncbi:arylsulfatase [Algoriphagus sp. oki45]|uniref:arylsulfatase n=1 Tax=Algoriphagus sp. oki45 TaxID=3067294 RepID=UPI0027F1D674|nr:arylsulfatase [Algoriphagus sp. oki45]
MYTKKKSRLVFLLVFGMISFSTFAQETPLSMAKPIEGKENWQAEIPRPKQDLIAADKLAALRKKTGKKPNILWFLIDDMGYGDPGFNGGGASIGAATPHMDRLAKEGLKLTSTYSQPTCTPTRSAILTGRIPARTGLTRPILAGDKLTKNPWTDEMSLPAILSQAGYSTVLTGKWHIGELEGMRPFEVGFDEYYGYYAAEKEISQSFDKRRYPDLVLDPFKLNAYQQMGASKDLVYGKKGGKEELVKETTGTQDMAQADQVLKEFSLKKIKEFAQSGKPFFLEHSFMKVHTDVWASKEFEGKSASKYPYKDGIVEVDAIIGEIVAELEKQGLLENTFIFITSDNGPQMDAWPDSGFTPFRGTKGSAWEGGTRVPGVAYWKGMIGPGRESAELFDLMDLYNTSAYIAGALDLIPTDRPIDGINQTSFLLADDGQSKRDRIHTWVETQLVSIRLHEYKMYFQVTESQDPHLMIDQSTVTKTGLAPWLFNLYLDPKESRVMGHALSPWTAVLAAEAKYHAASFRKFPPKDVGLGQ